MILVVYSYFKNYQRYLSLFLKKRMSWRHQLEKDFLAGKKHQKLQIESSHTSATRASISRGENQHQDQKLPKLFLIRN